MAGGKPIDIEITTDVDGVVKGTEKVADSFGDVQDALKDTAKASDKASKDIKDDVEAAAKVIDRDLTKSLDEAADQAKSTGKSIGKSVKDGTEKAGEATGTFKDETRQNLSESVSSFRGDIEDIPQLLQDVLGGVSADLGAVGGIVAIAGAAAIGLTIAALQGQADEINRTKESVLDLAKEIEGVGGDLSKVDFASRMKEWGLAVQDTKEWWELWQKEAKSGFDVVKEESLKAGTQWEEAFKGAHGSMDDSLKFLRDTESEYKRLNSEIDTASETVDEFGRGQSSASKETQDAAAALGKQREAAQKNAEAVRDANRAAWDAVNVGKTENSVLDEQLTLKNHLADVNKSAVTSELDLADAHDALKAKLAESTAVYSDHTAASRENERAIIGDADAINSWSQSQVDAGANAEQVSAKVQSQKDALIDQATKFFGSRDAAAAYIDQLIKTPKRIDTDVNVNGIPDAEEQVRQFTAKGRHLYIDLKTGDASSVENYIAGMNGRKVYVDIAPRNGVGITN